MSIENVQTILGRAVTEPEYRELLFSDPGAALEGYELSEEEMDALKGLEREKFDAVASELEDRISMASSGIGALDPKRMVVRDKIARELMERFIPPYI